MSIAKITTAVVGTLSMLGASSVAMAAPVAAPTAASKLSLVSPARAGAKVAKKNAAIETGVIIAVLAAAAVVVGVVVLDDNDSN